VVLSQRIVELARVRRRFGYRRIHDLLRRETLCIGSACWNHAPRCSQRRTRSGSIQDAKRSGRMGQSWRLSPTRCSWAPSSKPRPSRSLATLSIGDQLAAEETHTAQMTPIAFPSGPPTEAYRRSRRCHDTGTCIISS